MSSSTPNRNIASLTSYPARLEHIGPCLESIFGQSVQPDKVILYLSKEEVNEESEAIEGLALGFPELEIAFVEHNIRSHKKWFYSLKQYRTANVMLFDDDLMYPPDVVENLLEYHERFPNAVISRRSHLITTDGTCKITEYLDWIHEAPKANPKLVGQPRFDLFATTGAGTLFPAPFHRGRARRAAR